LPPNVKIFEALDKKLKNMLDIFWQNMYNLKGNMAA